MSALTFTLKTELKQRLDCSPLTPNLLAGKSVAEIAAIELQSGNRKVRVDAVFDITGDDAEDVAFAKATAKLDYIGKGLTAGCITVEGDVGAYLGQQAKGGAIYVSGNAGAYVANELKNGEIVIGGNAGDYVGAALPGNKKGMQGGIVIIKGNAGDRVGDHLRRGSILIEGNAGAYLGARMTAGTIGVLGSVGAYPGYAMKRGTLLLLNAPAEIPPTFNDCGTHTLGFLPLLLKGYHSFDTRFAGLSDSLKRVRRYAGDLSGLGKGEILVAV
ncbi:formylmethanofuran dehydrogenase subunit C [Methylococcus sp. EFPC2]|uniref:formylmethanofuran dehydrogenase subunit C n=1 Tax=Methylococcus sp. EFPC2 TaxID=2812648 RepID=UPI0019682010|nr:formylmethanofuran dehydrogenase subunit C [Methylococcus sp. EFPC2]QSA96957.1 formylmethanofuran dehydrogenase subunit C [Methylococcus sp. EFPC2]